MRFALVAMTTVRITVIFQAVCQIYKIIIVDDFISGLGDVPFA